MNQHDRKQLNYIMSLSDQDFESWSLGCSDRKIQWAIELIQQAREELAQQEEALEDELVESDLSAANTVLKQFMLGNQ